MGPEMRLQQAEDLIAGDSLHRASAFFGGIAVKAARAGIYRWKQLCNWLGKLSLFPKTSSAVK